MALKGFFDDQVGAIRTFLCSPDRSLHVVQHDPEMAHVLRKLLVRLDDADDSPHVLVASEVPFDDEPQFFCALLEDVVDTNESSREALASAGVDLPKPGPATVPAHTRLVEYMSAVAQSLPDSVGAYALVLAPARVSDPGSFRKAMTFLSEHTICEWAKYLVLEPRASAALTVLGESSRRASVQEFHLSPASIRKQIRADLEDPATLSPLEIRQYTTMMGAFAFAERDYVEAEGYQERALQLAREGGSPTDQASALFNLGNTCLARDELERAEDLYGEAAKLSLDAQAQPLLAMILTNLGIALHRRGQTEPSLEVLETARRTFGALRTPPGEAYVLDAKAATLAASGRHDEAERAWLDALAAYERITSKAMADVREHGRSHILAALSGFYAHTRQRAKLSALQAEEGA